ncbi:CoA-binding protein [Prolixibacteraceae bacterium Z1-6]|uniref:CoA-binding protein n=1 Tax=Draconibacterium aestuarii TaxID=2998507 RepID=A0A9X3FE43_9BACT|nr:CoA-binding protein [Prolixibacteraceae bacterium Z1-6]
MMTNKKTLVIGASENPARYSNKAIRALRLHNHDVVALAKRVGKVEDVVIQTEFPESEKIDTVSLYLGPQRQIEYYSQLVDLNPKRVIFNPGTENYELAELLEKNDIAVEEACTLVLLSIGDY